MKKFDLKTIILVLLGISQIYLLVQLKKSDREFNDLTVRNLKVVNQFGETTVLITEGGWINTFDRDGKRTLVLGNTEGSEVEQLGGGIKIFNEKGKNTIYVDTRGIGFYNSNGNQMGFIGTGGLEKGGCLSLFDENRHAFFQKDLMPREVGYEKYK